MAGIPTAERFRKPVLLGLALVLLCLVGFLQGRLNSLRSDPELELTRTAHLENAPPVLAFTTVALGGFRGLIANALWVRANDMQYDDKYFELVQLADWITKLEPHFVQVWLVQAWNMAYNISVKFSAPEDRWRWVRRGIELLRDQGIQYNPHEGLIYRELAWFFQHKMGQNMDDAHMYYKVQWAQEMTALFGGGTPDFEALANPSSDAERQQLDAIRNDYKMDLEIIQEVDEKYGPLDWRLPETSAIYWAVVGMKMSKDKDKDLSMLRRVIYQSLQMASMRGRMWLVKTQGENGERTSIRLAPNLDLVDKVNEAYLQVIAEDEDSRESFQQAHQAYLREIIYLLYAYNRITAAREWMAFTRNLYPDAIPAGWSVEEYSLRRLTANLGNMSHDKMGGLIEALIEQSFFSLSIGENDRSLGLITLARQVWTSYMEGIAGQEGRLGFPPFQEMIATTRGRLLAPGGMDPLLQAQLRTELGLPAPEGE